MEESQFIDPPRRSRADNQIVATLHTRGVVGEGVQVAGLITSCPRFVVCVAEGDPRFRLVPASAIAFGDGGVQKGGRVNRTLHVLKGLATRAAEIFNGGKRAM